MFQFPADTLPLWVGVSLVSLAVLGVVTGLPATAPEATPLATTVESVAASPHAARAAHPFDGRARVDGHGVTLVAGDETAHATFDRGPVVPVASGPLARVLAGVPPAQLYDSPVPLARAIDRRRGATVTVHDRLVVRHVTWGEVDVTLVG